MTENADNGAGTVESAAAAIREKMRAKAPEPKPEPKEAEAAPQGAEAEEDISLEDLEGAETQADSGDEDIPPPKRLSSAERATWETMPKEAKQWLSKWEQQVSEGGKKVAEKATAAQREFEAQRAAVEQERQHYRAQLDQLVPALQRQAQGKYANVDWVKLSKDDPYAFVQLQAEYQKDMAQFQHAAAEQQRLAQQAREETQKKDRDVRLAEHNKLVNDPALKRYFGDDDKSKDTYTRIAEFLVKSGVPKDRVPQAYEAPVVKIILDAMEMRRLRSEKMKKLAEIKSGQKLQKPGTGAQPANQPSASITAKTKQLAKTGSVHDAAAVIRAKMEQARKANQHAR